jgi:WD40 repeat protein
MQQIFTHADSNISAIEFEPVRERYLAQATQDKRLIIWDISSESVKFNINLASPIIQIEWSHGAKGALMLLLSNGKLSLEGVM